MDCCTSAEFGGEGGVMTADLGKYHVVMTSNDGVNDIAKAAL